MDRRRFLLTSMAGALAAPLGGEAEQAAKVARIGWLALNLAAAPTYPRPSVKDCVTSATSKAATS
jgi:hypothetical protein